MQEDESEQDTIERELGGRYQIVRALGRGASGAVYLARERQLHRMVAIKALHAEHAWSEAERARLRQEARTIANLSHPAIVPLLAFEETATSAFMVMPYAGGETLADRLHQEQRLAPAEVRRILIEIADALAYAHGEGVLHRDIKPGNILLERAGAVGDDRPPRVRLLDFGIAAFPGRDLGIAGARAAAGTSSGTTRFMSPEQALGETELDGRSDLFALGTLGYLMLAGTVPFDGASSAVIVARICAGERVPLTVAAPEAPAGLVAAIDKCLDPNPAERWRRAGDLRDALVGEATPGRTSAPLAFLGRLGVRRGGRRGAASRSRGRGDRPTRGSQRVAAEMQAGRGSRIPRALAGLGGDLRFAARTLRKTPGFTATIILTLTLALGATTAIFSVVEGVLLQPLPLTAPGRVVRVYDGVFTSFAGGSTSPLNFLDWRAQSRSFSGMAATHDVTADLTGACPSRAAGCEPEQLRATAVSANFFSVLGAHMTLGRAFAPGEDQPGSALVAILGDELWRSRFGADSSIVGRPIAINGQATTVVGIAGPGLTLAASTEIWLPLIFSPAQLAPGARGRYILNVYGRLRPGVTVAAAHRDVAAIVARLTRAYPETNPPLTRPVRVVGLHENSVATVRRPLIVLFAAVTLVLLIACANVANLLLVRAAGRETEIAVRTALGARRWHIVRQLLTESVALSAVSGALATLLAWYGVHLLTAFGPASIPRLGAVHIDTRVLAFAAAVAILTGIAFGLVPALHAVRSDLQRSLRESARGSVAHRGRGRLRNALVVVEFAFSLMLLAGAALLIKSFHRIMLVDPGFRPEHVMTFTVDLPATAYRTPQAIRAFAATTLERLQHLPGVRSAALSFGMDERAGGSGFAIDGGPAASASAQPLTAMIPDVTSGFFQTMGIPLISGRVFTPADRNGSAPVAIFNRSAARRFFPGANPVGHSLHIEGLDSSSAPPRRIVGVVGDTRTFGLTEPPAPQIYVPLPQNPVRYLIGVIRTTGDPVATMPAARRTIHDVDPYLPITHEWTMEQRTLRSVRQPRFYMVLLGLFAGVALVLAAIGIYGVTSYVVRQRQHELGIRIALGATPRDVLRLIVAQGTALIVIGLAAGLAAAVGLSHTMASLLFEVAPTDPATYVTASILLTVIALLACIIPARRAAAADPMASLRAE